LIEAQLFSSGALVGDLGVPAWIAGKIRPSVSAGIAPGITARISSGVATVVSAGV
jgi:hypothetical protein